MVLRTAHHVMAEPCGSGREIPRGWPFTSDKPYMLIYKPPIEEEA